MPKYELKGRLVFTAKDLNDAFRKLADHFDRLSKGEPAHLPEAGTEIKVKEEGVDSPKPLISTIPPPPRVPSEVLDKDD